MFESLFYLDSLKFITNLICIKFGLIFLFTQNKQVMSIHMFRTQSNNVVFFITHSKNHSTHTLIFVNCTNCFSSYRLLFQHPPSYRLINDINVYLLRSFDLFVLLLQKVITIIITISHLVLQFFLSFPLVSQFILLQHL